MKTLDVTCDGCGYNWEYKGKDGKLLPRATCPSCGKKTATGA